MYDSSDEEGLGRNPANSRSPALSILTLTTCLGYQLNLTLQPAIAEIASPDTLSMLLHDVVDSEDDENKEDNDHQKDSSLENTYDLMASIE